MPALTEPIVEPEAPTLKEIDPDSVEISKESSSASTTVESKSSSSSTSQGPHSQSQTTASTSSGSASETTNSAHVSTTTSSSTIKNLGPAAQARELLPVDALIRKTFLNFSGNLPGDGKNGPGSENGSDSSANHNKFLQGVPLFKRLPIADIPLLAQAMQVKKFSAGSKIFSQGDRGDAFYVIFAGEANVLVKDKHSLKIGDKVVCVKDLHFGGNKIIKGSHATVDKFDASREFPYTIRVAESGYRGRILAEEVELINKDGQGSIPLAENLVATLRPGDYFGEQSLLKGAARAATIVAVSDLTTFCLTRDKFKQFALGSRLHFGKRKAVVAPAFGDEISNAVNGGGGGTENDKNREEIEQIKKAPKSAEDIRIIKEGLKSNANLRALMSISDDQLETLCSKAYKQKGIKKGEKLITQGDLYADKFYIVHKGKFDFHVANASNNNSSSRKQGSSDSESDTSSEAAQGRNELDRLGKVGEAVSPMSFGELALLYHSPRAATVICTEDDSEVWVIERYEFKLCLMHANDQKMALYMQVFDNVDLFNVLTYDEKVSLAEVLVEVKYMQNDNIVVEGEPGDAFYILTEGKINFMKKGVKVHSVEATKGGRAHWFGERALLKKDVREATATVGTESATCLALTRAHFEALLGPLQELMLQHAKQQNQNEANNTQNEGTNSNQNGTSTTGNNTNSTGPNANSNSSTRKIEMSDLKRVGLLGCGGFGAVTLERHKTTGEVFALKALSKGYIVKMKMQKGVIREKEILLLCNSKFIVKLYQTFKSKEHLFFLLEPAMGGELFATYHKRRFHGSVSKARFYSGSVIFAFEHLHERHIVFRDLKPENLLLDTSGFCKLTDMGLAKVVTNGKTYTTCGTPDYFAPEVIQQTGMTKAVDWWTLGILIHELLSGHAPFDAKDPMETYQKIIRGVSCVPFSYKERDPEAVELVKGLLRHCPSERLPMRSGGTENLKRHPWYRGVDFNGLFDQKIKPPYVPEVKGNADLSNFRAQEADLPPQVPYKDPGTGWEDAF